MCKDKYGEDLKLRVNCEDMDMIRKLLDMAINDKYPDGTFSDFDCNVWGAMREVLRHNGIDCT